MNSFFRKLRWLAKRPRKESDLHDELQFHLEEEADQRRDAGAPLCAARSAARRELGNIALVQENTRSTWGWPRWEQFASDALFGMRQIRRNPGFSAIAIATLALGIGGITAMFSAFDAILVRPLPYAHAERLVTVWDYTSKGRVPQFFPAPAEVLQWRRLNTVFSDIALTEPAAATLSGGGFPEQAPARKAMWNLWNVLGVSPLIGRVFTEEEDTKGVNVAIISYGLWQRRFGGARDIVGRKISVNDTPYEVIGVMPREFWFLPASDIDIWMPASFPAWLRKNMGWHDASVAARLKPGVTLARARQAMTALSMQVTAKNFGGPHPAIVTPLREEIAGKTQTALVLLLCASAALLLIACVNLANLLLSRGAVRAREVAVRAALGAGRSRLIAQFLTESLMLAVLGTAVGLALAVPAMRFLESLAPEEMGGVRMSLDWRVLGFSAVAGIGAALTFGLAPALRGSRPSPVEGLREAGRGIAGPRRHWLQHSLIVVETALAVALLTSGGVLLQALQHLRHTDLGMRADRLLTLETPLLRYRDFDKRMTFLNQEFEAIRAIPGVINVGVSSTLPLKTMNTNATFYAFPGQPKERISQQVALFRDVSRDYLATIGAYLREGRFFDSSDRRSGTPVAIVNESFANRNFPGRSPLGERFQYGNTSEKGYWYTIVGVVKEVREVGMAEELLPTVYKPLEQADQIGAETSGVVIRAAVDPASLVPAIREAIWSIDKEQPIWRVQTFDTILDRQLSTPAQSTALMSAFAVLALLLASIGLYGVLSYAVSQRTNEIGVRMALGASGREILLGFTKRGLALTLAGLAVGFVLAAIAARSMTVLLYGFRPDYIPTAASVSLILLVVAAFACLIPARRASRIDPVMALRNE
jgi:putative ABC transport system permease protein